MGWEVVDGTASASIREKGWTDFGTVTGYTEVIPPLTSPPSRMSKRSDVC